MYRDRDVPSSECPFMPDDVRFQVSLSLRMRTDRCSKVSDPKASCILWRRGAGRSHHTRLVSWMKETREAEGTARRLLCVGQSESQAHAAEWDADIVVGESEEIRTPSGRLKSIHGVRLATGRRRLDVDAISGHGHVGRVQT